MLCKRIRSFITSGNGSVWTILNCWDHYGSGLFLAATTTPVEFIVIVSERESEQMATGVCQCRLQINNCNYYRSGGKQLNKLSSYSLSERPNFHHQQRSRMVVPHTKVGADTRERDTAKTEPREETWARERLVNAVIRVAVKAVCLGVRSHNYWSGSYVRVCDRVKRSTYKLGEKHGWKPET